MYPIDDLPIAAGGCLTFIAVVIGGTALGHWLGGPTGWVIFLSMVLGLVAWYFAIGWLVRRFDK